MPTFAPDPHSYGRPEEARVRHVGIALAVDFARRVLEGVATLELEVADGVTEVVLDTRRLAIRSVADGTGAPLAYRLAEEDALLGAALTVTLPRGVTKIAVAYATAPDAEALQWLDPGQTAGGAQPFLFTQGHAIQSRSWLPIQDSPGVRVTYDARITVPIPLVAVMSAERLGVTATDVVASYHFLMREPIPAYLIALAVGELASRDVGERTAVFAEPGQIAAAAHELGELERMVEAAESLIGPYLWGRFDVVVMPRSFPYGGMENPRLVFASPSLIAGDRSLTTVIVHELAHAWAGNLVTNATWNDFWINEGTTVYLELRLNELLWGEERASLLRSWGHRELSAEVERAGQAAPDTRLRYEMTGRDPAEGVTVIPYLKGAAFFWALEAHVGRARLDTWMKGWFRRRAFQSVTTATLLADLREHLFAGATPPMDLDRWVDAPGLWDEAAPPPSALEARVDAAARGVLAGEDPCAIDTALWTPQAWRMFLATLLAAKPAPSLIAALDAAFGLSSSRNCEVLTPWLRLQIHAQMEASAPQVEAFLSAQGRMKYLRPLYTELLASAWGAPIAKRAFEAARPGYHALVRAGLDRLFVSALATSPASGNAKR